MENEIKWWESEMPDREKEIKEIESRTKEDVINILKREKLGINKRIKFQDYSIAKKIIFKGQFITSGIYGTQIGWILDYLKM